LFVRFNLLLPLLSIKSTLKIYLSFHHGQFCCNVDPEHFLI
jgi:hypothetical protein